MTSGHLVADGNLSLLRDIDPDGLVYAGRQLVAILSRKHLRVYDDPVSAVGHL